MKNFKLLLATTAILSMGTMRAMADDPVSPLEPIPSHQNMSNADTSILVHAKAIFVSTPTIAEDKELSFGGIINPVAGQVVVVNSDGTLGAETTAQVITSSNNYGYGIDEIEPRISEGHITVSGDLPSDYYVNTSLTGTFAGIGLTLPESITLTGGENGAITCGIVDTFTQKDDSAGNGVSFGGKLKVSSFSMPSSGNLSCEGSGTATLILNAYNDQAGGN